MLYLFLVCWTDFPVATQRLDSATNSVVLLFFCFPRHVNIKVLTNIFPFLFYSFSPSKEKEPANVCQEKPDLRLCHGFHHQCHAYCSQSNAAKWHGVTPCTVSIGSGQNSHDLTSSLSLQPKLDQPQSKHVSKQSIKLFYFTVNLFTLKVYIYLKVPCRYRQSDWTEEGYICFTLTMSPCGVTGLT